MEYIQFTPANGHLLLELIEDTSKFKINKKSEGLTSEAKLGKVLKVGAHFVNDFGVERHKPCKPGDKVVYVHEINQNVLTIDFIDYPIVRFGAILGVIKNE